MAARSFELTTRLAPPQVAARANETARCGDLVRIRATPETVRAYVIGGPIDVPLRLRATVTAGAEGSVVAGDVRPSIVITASVFGVTLAVGVAVGLALALPWGVWFVGLAVALTMVFAWRRAARRLDERGMQAVTDSVRLLVRPDSPNRAQRKKARRAGRKR